MNHTQPSLVSPPMLGVYIAVGGGKLLQMGCSPSMLGVQYCCLGRREAVTDGLYLLHAGCKLLLRSEGTCYRWAVLAPFTTRTQ